METVVVELVPVVEGGALGLQHHQDLLGEAKPALAGGRAEGGGLGLEGPGDVVVPLLHQPLVLQRPDIVAEASVAALGDLLEVLFVASTSTPVQSPQRTSRPASSPPRRRPQAGSP